MANGVSITLANSWLDALANNTSYAEAAIYAKLHTGDPGSAGTTAASAETTRKALSFAAATNGSVALDTTASWTSWPVGANGEVISDVSVWDDTTAGNFLFSANLAANKTLNTGDTFNLTNLTVTFTTAT